MGIHTNIIFKGTYKKLGFYTLKCIFEMALISVDVFRYVTASRIGPMNWEFFP